nr:6-phosphogluconolactonase [Chlamydiota bacterium]
NYIPQKECWRMTFTFDLINKAHAIYFYVLGENKADILERVLLGEENFPSQRVGTAEHKASWVIDDLAAQKLLVKLK